MPVSSTLTQTAPLCQILINETTNSDHNSNEIPPTKKTLITPVGDQILKRRHSWSKRESVDDLNSENFDPNLSFKQLNPNHVISYSCNDKIHSFKDIKIITKSPWDILCKLLNCKVAFKKQHHNGKKYNWIQLAGHAGRFIAGEREGFILKLLDDSERQCLKDLQTDVLSSYVPKIDNIILNTEDKKHYMELQDLLYKFMNPSIMDIKIGTRTFLEYDSEDEKESKPRHDLYLKLIEMSPDEPSAQEHAQGKITKKRYMSWRERSSCSSNLGFRIEAIKRNQVSEREFYTVKEKSQVLAHLKSYTNNNKTILDMYLRRLIDLKSKLINSTFFAAHEMIGSSLLFVHDNNFASIWIIDFGKTRRLPAGIRVDHLSKWVEGNHEDGYLFGINNLIEIFQEALHN